MPYSGFSFAGKLCAAATSLRAAAGSAFRSGALILMMNSRPTSPWSRRAPQRRSRLKGEDVMPIPPGVPMLESNRSRVQQLTGREIWMFILGRSLMAFGAGVLVMGYFPTVASPLAWPTVVVGLVLFLIAARGLARRRSSPTA